MSEISLLKDSAFLKKLDIDNNKVFYTKILVLDKNEYPIRAIEGRVSTGSITIDGSSSIRRTCSLTFLAEETTNDLTDVDNLLSINKKVKILVGIENNVNDNYDKIIWFNQGIFVITQPSLSHSTSGVTISLQLKDKMCLLNGECGGNLPTSVTFDNYDQIIGLTDCGSSFPTEPNNYTVYKVNDSYYMWSEDGWEDSSIDMVGEIISVPQRIYDIIQTLVCNYGKENISKIIINDIDLEIRNSVRYVGSDLLYHNTQNGIYTMDEEVVSEDTVWQSFAYNADCGYEYTDFTYPGGSSGLVSAIGDNVCTVLDKIKSALGNYEYFYDVEGNFVFQEIKNYLNTTYDPVQTTSADGFLLSEDNYYIDLSNNSQSVYTFEEGSTIISAYSNSPSYTNIKNDFHIWGKNQDGYAIHYHIAIKEKPTDYNSETYSTPWSVVYEKDDDGSYTGKLHLPTAGETASDTNYIPTDWRALLYLQGLQKKINEQRPDIYEQELLDLFDGIYNMKEKCFKVDITNNANELQYWFDYISPSELLDISVDSIGQRIYSYQQDNIKRLYNPDIPNFVLINVDASEITQNYYIEKCKSCGQLYSHVSSNIYDNVAIGTVGYSAQEVARDLLYQYTNYASSISISSIPIYYLDVNSRITVHDRASNINGDYIIKSINLPLDAKSTMSISASKALTRI